jgi:Glycosyltransferase 61
MTARRRLARARRRAGRLAWRAALGEVGGAVPGRYIRSLVERAWTQSLAPHLKEISLLAPAHVEHYKFDAALPAEFRRSKAFDDRYLYRLRDVCVAPRTGLCWLPGGPILAESYGSLIQLLGWNYSALDEPLVRSRERIEGPVAVLPGNGYFHWLLESLPATLHALRWAPDVTVLLPQDPPRYVEEALEIIGIDKAHRSDGPVRAEELVLVGRVPFSGFVPREDIEILRNVFSLRGGDSHEAVYVSRRFDSRGPANEVDLERALEGVGVRSVIAQTLSLAEQIELFAGARVIVGPHGAGLANLVWSRASHLTEVFAADHFNDCYARLAVTLGVAYSHFGCAKPPSPSGLAPVAEITAAVADNLTKLAFVDEDARQ